MHPNFHCALFHSPAQMSHGFDNVGRLFGPDRVLRDWWGPHTVAAYKARSSCLGEYYATFRSGGLNVDGNRTLGEDIADTGTEFCCGGK